MLVITVPLVIAGFIVVGVLVYRSVINTGDHSRTTVSIAPVAIPSLSATNRKPNVGFGSMQSAHPVSDLRQQYDASSDDGGISSLDALQEQASTL